MKILTTPRMERCIGCHSCSLACARLVHQRLSWDTAGIRIASSGGLSTGFEAAPAWPVSRPLHRGLSHRGLFTTPGRRCHCAQESLHPRWQVRPGAP